MGKPIFVRGYIPTASGYEPLENLTATERQAFGRRLTARMGKAIEPYIFKQEDTEDGISA